MRHPPRPRCTRSGHSRPAAPTDPTCCGAERSRERCSSRATVREALDNAFREQPKLRTYVLDDQGRLRKHVVIFVDGQLIRDRGGLSDSVGESSELLVMQALSGG